MAEYQKNYGCVLRFLSKVHFDGYNRRFASDGTREPLEWSEYKEEIEQFKREHIHQTIVDTEVNDLSYPC